MHRKLQILFFSTLSATLLGVCIYWGSDITKLVGSPRFYFILYVSTLLTCSFWFIFSKKAKIFWLLAGLACIELSLASLSSIVNSNGVRMVHLVPHLSTKDDIFTYHPLLGATPTPNFRSENSIRATGIKISHNSYGARGYDPRGLESKSLINVYGGSSTYDIGVNQGETWPEILEQLLDKSVLVSNQGVPGYSSSEHLIQSLFYYDRGGKKPICSVYYVGWNDIHNSHITTLERGYADYHLLTQYDNLQIRKPAWTNSFSPLHALFGHALYSNDWVTRARDYRGQATIGNVIDDRLLNYYFEHIEKIILINKSMGIETVIIGQILNPVRLISDKSYGWAPFIEDKKLWPTQLEVNRRLKKSLSGKDVTFIDLDVSQFQDNDFVDYGHFSNAGSRKFAELISGAVAKQCLKGK